MGSNFQKINRGPGNGVDASNQRRAGKQVDFTLPKDSATKPSVPNTLECGSEVVPASEVQQLHKVPKLDGSKYSCFVVRDGGQSLRSFYQMVCENFLVGQTLRLEIFNNDDFVVSQTERKLFSIGMLGQDQLQIALENNNKYVDFSLKSPDDAGKKISLIQI